MLTYDAVKMFCDLSFPPPLLLGSLQALHIMLRDVVFKKIIHN